MPNIKIAGSAVVITSAMKLEDLRTIAKYRPDALVVKGGEDGKEPVFVVSVTNGEGSINKYGASFAEESYGEEKLATITMSITPGAGDIKEVIADELGTAIGYLTQLEATLPEVLKAVKDERKALMENIEIIQ